MRGGGNAATGEHPYGRGGLDEFRELAHCAPVLIWCAGPDKLFDVVNRPYETAFDARRPFAIDHRLRRHDGAYRCVLHQGRPFERNSAFAGYLGSCIDIEERKRAEERQRIRLGGLNHRIKNMLGSVQALAHQTFRGGSESRTAYTALAAEDIA